MQDKIFKAFLERQYEDAMALDRNSDLVKIAPLDGWPPQRYALAFNCTGLIQSPSGGIVEADHFEVGVWFPSDYLRRAEPFEVLHWFGPPHIFHPNISNKAPFICIGRLAPGTPLVDIVYQCFEIITYNKVTMREDDALNRDACVWARANQHRLPVDRRPLKRRVLDLAIEEAKGTEQP